MVKYLRINNSDSNKFLNLLYKMKPTHSSLKVQELKDWMKEEINKYVIDRCEFAKCSFQEKLVYKGIVQHEDYYTTSNGVLLDIDNSKFIQFNPSTFYSYCEDIFNIIPELRKLDLLANFDLVGLYDHNFINKDKKFPDFSDEEWNELIEKSLKIDALSWTEDI